MVSARHRTGSVSSARSVGAITSRDRASRCLTSCLSAMTMQLDRRPKVCKPVAVIFRRASTAELSAEHTADCRHQAGGGRRRHI